MTILCLVTSQFSASGSAQTQVTQADYDRAASLRGKYQSLVINNPERVTWIGDTSHFWYRKSVKGGFQFVLVDAATLKKEPAFDHERLATSLSAAVGEKVSPLKLPFTTIIFVDNERAIEFDASNSRWRCALSDYTCTKQAQAPQANPGPTRRLLISISLHRKA
jgi:hypothetical protein